MEFILHPIGYIQTPFTRKEDTPIQAVRSLAYGRVEVLPEFVDGLKDIEGFTHIILLYYLHRSDGFDLVVKPFLDDKLHGVFATRHPRRPNPIGLSVVRLIKRSGNILEIEGVDMLDGTPLLDIKPFVEDFDARQGTSSGWFESRSEP